MKKLSILLLTIFCAGSLFADNIGYIEIERIYQEASSVQDFQEDLQKKQEKFQKSYEKQQEKVAKAREKGKSPEEIQEMISEIEEELGPQQQEIIQYEQLFQQQLFNELTSAAREASEEYGIDVVLDKRAVLYGGFNLTDQVIEKLNN